MRCLELDLICHKIFTLTIQGMFWSKVFKERVEPKNNSLSKSLKNRRRLSFFNLLQEKVNRKFIETIYRDYL